MKHSIIKQIKFVDDNGEECSLIIESLSDNKNIFFREFIKMERTGDIIVESGQKRSWEMSKRSFNHIVDNLTNFIPVSEETLKSIREKNF